MDCIVCGKKITTKFKVPDLEKYKYSETSICSKECYAKILNTGIHTVKCKNCGKHFSIWKNFSVRNYCGKCIEDYKEGKKSLKGRCNFCLEEDNLIFVDRESLEPLVFCNTCYNNFYLSKKVYMTVHKSFEIDVAHQLQKHPHCSWLHGHTIKIDVGVKDKLDYKTGMVIDFKILKNIIKEEIIDLLDHRLLNDTLGRPTAEFLAYFIFNKLRKRNLKVEVVKVYETKNNYVEYRGVNNEKKITSK